MAASDAWTWAYLNKIKLQASIFSLKGHQYQVGLMQEYKKRKQCAMKGSQLAFTESAVLKSLHGMIYGHYPLGVLYLFPSNDSVSDFSKTRFQPLITSNPAAIGKHVTDTDAVNVKKIGKSILYLRGARASQKIGGFQETSEKLKTVPADRIVFDERDEMKQSMVTLALERYSHSTIKEEMYLSTPSIPDFGIDQLYQSSDQRIWMVKCRKCGKYTCLELEFPECLKEISGKVIRACRHCHNEIYPKDGVWEIQYPDREMAGWRISQLNSIYVPPADILNQFRNPPDGRLDYFYNNKLAQAYIEAENRLTVEEIMALCSDSGVQSNCTDSCTMGVDQGKTLHVVIGKKHFSKAGQIVHIGIYRDWEELDRLMKVFNVQMCVVDALPEQRNARAFAERHKGKVYLNFYQERQKGMYRWNEESMTVSCNLTESLDASQNEVLKGNIIFPKNCEIMKVFAKHLHNVAKRLVEDEDKGTKRYVYIKLGEDHFRHAFGYEAMARSYTQPNIFDALNLDDIAA